MRIALYQPDIPQNTGTILRLAACLGVAVDLIGPAGFDSTDRGLKRAGLDYMQYARLERHISWERFLVASPPGRLVLLSTAAVTSFVDFSYLADDVLLFGRETAGVPPHVHAAADARLRVPMRSGLRSLNIAVTAAIVVGEALRQTDGFAGLS